MKKSKTRLFIEKRISQNLMIYIKEKQHHFIKNVLRVKLNDVINVFDGITGEWRSQVISISKDKTALKIEKKIREFETQPDIWLIFAPIKLFRLNIIIQKAVELGVSKFVPCKTEFSNFDKLNYTNLELNAIEAAQQCERLDVPKIEKIINLDKSDAIICLGAIIRGETTHYELISENVFRSISGINEMAIIPVINGILTTENEDQAKKRIINGNYFFIFKIIFF